MTLIIQVEEGTAEVFSTTEEQALSALQFLRSLIPAKPRIMSGRKTVATPSVPGCILDQNQDVTNSSH